ncbi:cupin domain-containing protein [Sphingosinicella terrae]|uniref:cupin domain-containing protein n=1 Tax=Sphingosinicella terrae TaxID=2172047 RepID=UPI0013B4760F|nr:cupin domain-containing protein [Sphingosinicella terrae]
MRSRPVRIAIGALLALACGAGPAAPLAPAAGPQAGGVSPAGLILQVDEGERRVRRSRADGAPGLTTPFILKVDRRNGGSQHLMMGYEEIAPGDSIRPHRHLVADEIIFVHRGSGRVGLGGREARVESGATIYIPRETRITLHNDGTEPLAIAFIFSAPGFEELMRDNSVLEGEADRPIDAAERRQIEARNSWHTVHEAH